MIIIIIMIIMIMIMIMIIIDHIEINKKNNKIKEQKRIQNKLNNQNNLK